MSRKCYNPEQIIGMLRQAEVELAQGKRIGEVCRSLGISEQSYYRWRSEYGGLKLDQARRMKGLEKENGRLSRASSITSRCCFGLPLGSTTWPFFPPILAGCGKRIVSDSMVM